MIETKNETHSQLTGAGYLYLLKETPSALARLQGHLTKDYEPMGGEFGANLDDAHLTHFYMVKKGTDERLDVHIQSLGTVLVLSLLTFLSPDPTDGRPGQDLLDGCQAALGSGGNAVLGSALIIISRKDPAPALGWFKETVGRPLAELTATRDGHVLRQLVGPGPRQYFLIEGEASTSLHDFVATELPQLGWSLQRLNREWDFYQDRIKTVSNEKAQIDNELSQMLHRKVGGALTAEAAQVLDEQISRLSSMYSILATDLHLINEATANFEKDLTVLSRQAGDFDPSGDSDFPHSHVANFQDGLKSLLKHEADLRLSLENTKAAIDISQTQAEILRGRQGLALQEQTRELLNQNLILEDERMSLQIAAQVIELVIIFYYTLKSWEAVAAGGAVEALPSAAKFGVVATFSAAVVALTHFIGASLHKRRFLVKSIAITAGLALLSLATMAALPGWWRK